jgi:hypothetical protein
VNISPSLQKTFIRKGSFHSGEVILVFPVDAYTFDGDFLDDGHAKADTCRKGIVK